MTNGNLTDDSAEPIRLVEARCHDRHRGQVAELVPLTATVDCVSVDHAEPPTGLKGVPPQMQLELEAHIQNEEVIFLPDILAGQTCAPEHLIVMTRAGHANHGRGVKDIWRRTNGLALPVNPCRSCAAVYTRLGGYLDNLRTRIRLENDMLLHRFQSAGVQNG